MGIYLVLRRRGPGFAAGAPVEGKPDWDGHAACKIRLAKAGALLLSGPFGEREGALLVFRADSQEQVEAWVEEDPWTASGVLVTEKLAPWDVRIGALP